MPQSNVNQTNNNKAKQRSMKLKKKSLKFDLRKGGKAQPEDRNDLPYKKTTTDFKRL